MSSLSARKRLVRKIPEPLGKVVARVPYSVRLGPSYRRWSTVLRRMELMSEDELAREVGARFAHAVQRAYRTSEVYREIYDQAGLDVDSVVGLEDLDRVPIVRKSDVRGIAAGEVPRRNGLYRVNTGGTSGEPLELLLCRDDLGREWAHMLHVWRKVGYTPRQAKLTFRVGLPGMTEPLAYSAVGNEFRINPAADPRSISDALTRVLARTRIGFIHGYPSAVAEYCAYIRQERPELADRLARQLKGVLLGSEYPAPHYRDTIDDVLGVPTVSWFGHTEGAILAWERETPFEYVPFHSYGLTEGVAVTGSSVTLVGTSWSPHGTPFVRYDTGDIVEAVHDTNGLVRRFTVTEGRLGEFVVDRQGVRVSLTGIIFGRHHEGFGRMRHVQVLQDEAGSMTLLLCAADGVSRDPDEAGRLFDFRDVDIEVSYRFVDAPVKTAAGKVPLLVSTRT